MVILQGDALSVLKTLESGSVHVCITSPPYWGLRDYGAPGQLGLEETPEEYVAKMVDVFREVRRVLRDDGTLWLNVGDSYIGGRGGRRIEGYKPKDLCGIPWMVAFALRADGWYLRSDIIWNKPNPMPESVTDRPTKAHEYIFLLSKSERYFYDAEAIKEKAIYFDDIDRYCNGRTMNMTAFTKPKKNEIKPIYKDARSYNGKHSDKRRGHLRRHAGFNDRWDQITKEEQCGAMRNKRDVWTIAASSFPGSHFATFPKKLIVTPVLAGCPSGGLVMDPFCGSGTTGVVALANNRRFLGIELNPAYVKMANSRIGEEVGLLEFMANGA